MENHDFEIAYLIAESKDLMQTWYQVDGCAHSPCYSLQHAASHISRFKVWTKIYIFIKIEINDGGEGLNSCHRSSTYNSFILNSFPCFDFSY
jgi:hypothetical protein